MVELVTPWLITLCLGFLVFLYGKYLQREEKRRRDKFSVLLMRSVTQSESALSSMHPPDQKTTRGGIAGMQGQHQTSGLFH